MNIIIKNKDKLLDFLQAAQAVNEQCILKINNDGFKSISQSTCTTHMITCECDALALEDDMNDPIRINIPSLSRFIWSVQAVNTELSDVFEMAEDKRGGSGAYLKYRSKPAKFTYHLLRDSFCQEPRAKYDKVMQFACEMKFNMLGESFKNILKARAFTINANKCYFYTKDGSVHCDINDRTTTGVDSVDLEVSEEYEGEQVLSVDTKAISIEAIRSISTLKFQSALVQISTDMMPGIMIIDMVTDHNKFRYVVSPMKN